MRSPQPTPAVRSVVHPFPSSLSHTFRDEEINSDVVLAGLFDDDGNGGAAAVQPRLIGWLDWMEGWKNNFGK